MVEAVSHASAGGLRSEEARAASTVRERGVDDDLRMIPVAVAVWGAALATHEAVAGGLLMPFAVTVAVVCILVGAFCLIPLLRLLLFRFPRGSAGRFPRGLPSESSFPARHRHRRGAGAPVMRGMRHEGSSGYGGCGGAGRGGVGHAGTVRPDPWNAPASAPWGVRTGVLLLLAAGLAAACSTAAQDIGVIRDVVLVDSLADAGPVSARGVVRSPAVRSASHDADCRADVRLWDVTGSRTVLPIRLDAVALASGTDCSLLRQGSTVHIRGDVGVSPFDAWTLWIRASSDGVGVESGPGPLEDAVSDLHRRFFDVTGRLPDQGRILVPGLTIGVTGAELVDAGSGDEVSGDLDPAYVELVEQGFSKGGIMHLMAVSGGHFLLLTGLVTRLCRRLLAPRVLTAVICAASCLLLAVLMAPSDSVTRALCSGLLSAAALGIGRRPRPCSATCWTAAAVIILDPDMARSIGFALSCAAVLGIVLASGPLSRLMEPLLGRHVGAALAVTIAAQVAALPIQTLVEPGIPLWAPLINLLVTPVVGVSTIFGLLALAICPLSVAAALPFAWTASCGTAVMASAVGLLDGAPLVVLPWVPGPAGAALLAAVVVCGVMAFRRLDSVRAGVGGSGVFHARTFLVSHRHALRFPGRAPESPCHARDGTGRPRRVATDGPCGRPFLRSPAEVLARWLADTEAMLTSRTTSEDHAEPKRRGGEDMSTDGKRLKG